MRHLSLCLLLVTLNACDCGGTMLRDGGSELDSGSLLDDSGVDAGATDGGAVDGGVTDAGVDGGVTDAGVDAGIDAGLPAPLVCAPLDGGTADGGMCAPGTADCDLNPSDCETTITSDAMNCGRCGRSCGGTATCSNGLCGATVLLDPDVSSNYCHAIFTTDRLFAVTCWGNNDLSELRTAPIEPGPDVRGTSLVAYNNVSVVAMRGLTFDGPDVLFGLEGNPSKVFQVSATDGGPITTRFETDAGTRFDSLQVVDDTYYWVHNRHTAAGTVVGATIKKRGRTDTQDTTLVTGLGLAGQLVVTPTKLLWVEARTTTASISIYEAPRDGTAGNISLVKSVAVATPGTYMIRSGDFVYWTEKNASPNGKLRRYQFAHPNAVAQDVVTGLNAPEGLATDGAYLYFKQADAMYRVGMCGGTPEQLSPVVSAHDTQATEIYRVDDKYVYWAAGPGFGDSKIYRVAK